MLAIESNDDRLVGRSYISQKPMATRLERGSKTDVPLDKERRSSSSRPKAACSVRLSAEQAGEHAEQFVSVDVALSQLLAGHRFGIDRGAGKHPGLRGER